MKTIGLLGGTSWVSTIDYYRYINQFTNEKLGGDNFARCIIYSLNYGDIIEKNKSNDLEGLLTILTDACTKLQAGGAEAIILCANTMHRFADQLQSKIDLPFVHVAIATATEIKKQNLRKVALLGTKYTMELDFFKDKLAEQGIETIIPEAADRDFIHASIFEELGHNIFKPQTKARYKTIINRLAEAGAQGVILGCTEIPLIIKQEDSLLPVFDTALIHSRAAVEFALNQNMER